MTSTARSIKPSSRSTPNETAIRGTTSTWLLRRGNRCLPTSEYTGGGAEPVADVELGGRGGYTALLPSAHSRDGGHGRSDAAATGLGAGDGHDDALPRPRRACP